KRGRGGGGGWAPAGGRGEAKKELGPRDAPESHGGMAAFAPIMSGPRPVQKPHPPILLAGNGPNTLKRVVRYADGWMPNSGDYLSRIPELNRLAEEAARGPIPVTAYGSEGGGAAEIEQFQEAGIERVIYYVPPDGRDAALQKLEQYTELVRPYAETVSARAAT